MTTKDSIESHLFAALAAAVADPSADKSLLIITQVSTTLKLYSPTKAVQVNDIMQGYMKQQIEQSKENIAATNTQRSGRIRLTAKDFANTGLQKGLGVKKPVAVAGGSGKIDVAQLFVQANDTTAEVETTKLAQQPATSKPRQPVEDAPDLIDKIAEMDIVDFYKHFDGKLSQAKEFAKNANIQVPKNASKANTFERIVKALNERRSNP